MITKLRVPEFITQEHFNWAKNKASSKAKKDFSEVNFSEIEEGLVVQCLHVGSFDDEYITTKKIQDFIKKNNFEYDFSSDRNHHEIYLSDFRKTETNKLKTILRHPIK